MELVDDEFFENVIDAFSNDELNIKQPHIYFGKYEDYILITLDDSTRLIKFINKHGQVLTINKNKCDVETFKDINYYHCIEAPYILYPNNDIWINKELMTLFENYFN